MLRLVQYGNIHPEAHALPLGFSAGRSLTLLLCLLSLLLPFGSSAQSPSTSNPILPGDHPDPTVVRIGKSYWTTSTAGGWAPEFALFQSPDLHHWTVAGAVFPHTPAWATGDFWAPELVYDRGRVLVYYVARDHSGVLCVAAATAVRPQGPYTDHGPLLCQPDGSIDPSFARDEHGKPFLIWKEDGNSKGQPTPIWAQPLTEDLLHLTGEMTKLLVNDPASWEGGVVEAPYLLRHAGRFFLFYAGNACCGVQCHYAEGVARADHLLGPWVKDPANPIIGPNGSWRCPGHGTAVETPKGEDFFLYHAYPASGTIYVGRESVLDPINWSTNGWPLVNDGKGPGGGDAAVKPPPRPSTFSDDFRHASLDPEWKWPIGHEPAYTVNNGQLKLEPSTAGQPTFLGRSLLAADYTASVAVLTAGTAEAGLGVIGGRQELIVLATREAHLELWRESHGQREVVWTGKAGATPNLWLRVSSAGRSRAIFSYSLDRTHWTDAGDPVNVSDLVPWDQGLRIGLVAAGAAQTHAVFSRFSLADGEASR